MIKEAVDFFKSPIYEKYLGFLSNHYFEILTIHWIVIIALFVKNINYFKDFVSKIDKKTILILFIIFSSALFIRTVNYQDVLYDEGSCEYRAAAKFMPNQWIYCQYGNEENCIDKQVPSHPAGWTYILSVMFLIFGANVNVSILTTLFLGSLTTISIFFLSYMMFKKESISLIASSFVAFSPFLIKHSLASNPAIPSMFFLSLTFFIIFLSFEIKKQSLYLLSFLLTIFTMQIRPGNFLFLIAAYILAVCFFVENKKDFLNQIKKPVLISSLFTIPVWDLRIFSGLSYGNIWTGSGELLGISYIIKDFPRIINFLFNIEMNSFLILFFAIAILFGYKNNNIKFMIFWFIAFFLSILSFANFDGFVDRYLISLFIPLIILSSFGIHELSKKANKKNLMSFLTILTILIFLFLGNAFNVGHGNGSPNISLIELSEHVPDEAFLMVNAPEMILFEKPNQNVMAIQPLSENNYGLIPKLLKNGTEFYYIKHENLIRNYGNRHCHPVMYDNNITDLCELVEKNYNVTFVKNIGSHDLMKII